MEFLLKVEEISNDFPNTIKLKGDVDITIELPLNILGIKLSKGENVKLVLQQEKDKELHKYKVYAWGIVYYVGNNITRISIGGLQLDIMKELPLKVGEKVYIGII
ncbi:conserved hypothetical protein [Pyrobaculum islandicum DSM 4184]|uniref:Uncharacterized protein n=1 Tax=Pyrobaculum islandicum (strain DSM 4184 / JCM 9189 / GEO3) TaxID=384616 RepID=A1RT48_PYRIL|nr:hypothetical protein [Pyrobaculum islandicum]ABL88130.1 conserved hypothetical protein [Pyrobaculum islandicum DSM 4184]